MKNCKKILSAVMAAAFALNSVAADVALGQSGLSEALGDKLAVSSGFDKGINPGRAGGFEKDAAKKLEPGAVGNGSCLAEFAKGKLPERVPFDKAGEKIPDVLSGAIDLAIKLTTANYGRIQDAADKERACAALNRLIELKQHLHERTYLFKAKVRGPEDYLIGFSYEDNDKNHFAGLSLEAINKLRSYRMDDQRLNRRLLAQYIFHECVPEKGLVTERGDHRRVYRVIQTAIFGLTDVAELKKAFRALINEIAGVPQGGPASAAKGTAQKSRAGHRAFDLADLNGFLKLDDRTFKRFLLNPVNFMALAAASRSPDKAVRDKAMLVLERLAGLCSRPNFDDLLGKLDRWKENPPELATALRQVRVNTVVEEIIRSDLKITAMTDDAPSLYLWKVITDHLMEPAGTEGLRIAAEKIDGIIRIGRPGSSAENARAMLVAARIAVDSDLPYVTRKTLERYLTGAWETAHAAAQYLAGHRPDMISFEKPPDIGYNDACKFLARADSLFGAAPFDHWKRVIRHQLDELEDEIDSPAIAGLGRGGLRQVTGVLPQTVKDLLEPVRQALAQSPIVPYEVRAAIERCMGALGQLEPEKGNAFLKRARLAAMRAENGVAYGEHPEGVIKALKGILESPVTANRRVTVQLSEFPKSDLEAAAFTGTLQGVGIKPDGATGNEIGPDDKIAVLKNAELFLNSLPPETLLWWDIVPGCGDKAEIRLEVRFIKQKQPASGGLAADTAARYDYASLWDLPNGELMEELRKIAADDTAFIVLTPHERTVMAQTLQRGWIIGVDKWVVISAIEGYRVRERPKPRLTKDQYMARHAVTVAKMEKALGGSAGESYLTPRQRRNLMNLLAQSMTAELTWKQLTFAEGILANSESRRASAGKGPDAPGSGLAAAAEVLGHYSIARFADYKEYTTLKGIVQQDSPKSPITARQDEVLLRIATKIKARHKDWVERRCSIHNMPREARFLVNRFSGKGSRLTDDFVEEAEFVEFLAKAVDLKMLEVREDVADRFFKSVKGEMDNPRISSAFGEERHGFGAARTDVKRVARSSPDLVSRAMEILKEKAKAEVAVSHDAREAGRKARREVVDELRLLWKGGILPYPKWVQEKRPELFNKARNRTVFGNFYVALAAAGIPDHLWKIGSGGILKGYMSKDTVDQAIKDLGRSGKAVLEIDKVVADNSHILKAALRHYESWVEAVKFNTGIEIKFPDLPEVAELRIEETAAEAGVETAIDEPQSEPAAAAGEMAAAKGPGDAKLMGEISSALPARAQFFKTNLMNILARYPDKTFVLAVDTDLGRHHKSQIMPISKAIDEINALKGADDKPLFPNLRAIRAPGGRLARELLRLKYGESIELSRMFVAAQQENVENRAFDVVKGEAGAWITAIDDSVPGDYLPVFEALTLNMMMAAGAESQAIKSFYDSLSREPIDPARIDEAKRMRILYLVPKAARLEPDQLRKLYELAQAVHVAA